LIFIAKIAKIALCAPRLPAGFGELLGPVQALILSVKQAFF
jgi:hypothetical protein